MMKMPSFSCSKMTSGMLAMMMVLLALSFATTATAKEEINHGQELTDWLKREKGVLHPHIEIRKHAFGYGMFAEGDIPQDTLMLELPRTMVFGAKELHDEDYEAICRSSVQLADELIEAQQADGGKSKPSRYLPYINYLLSQAENQLPVAWSKQSQRLLQKVVGKDLPPQDMFELNFETECSNFLAEKKDVTDHDKNIDEMNHIRGHAFRLIMQRGWDQLLLPVYDLMSHSNGPRLNTDSNSVHDLSSPIRVTASRAIKAGEQIFTSYDQCRDCGAREIGYGVPELLRDYGFVEAYPQRWSFPFLDDEIETVVAFQLDPIEGSAPASWPDYSSNVTLKFLSDGHEDEFCVRILKYNLERLEELDLDVYIQKYMTDMPAIPSSELGTIRLFHEQLVKALRIGVYHMYADGDDNIEDRMPDDQVCTVAPDGTQDCSSNNVDIARSYDNLVGEHFGWAEHHYQCYEGRFMDFPEHKHLEWVRSQYQEIQYFQLESNLDTCFRLDGTIQICGRYRPHYHELVVHNTARYFDQVKRVVFVGGGDSMLLQEILKYPELEIVVGLEIDQKVTRGAFKHWGSQPHWDNPKVQWWFGDAGKSLLMLPKEYFGSFDMVLVDLSETVTSMLVTEGLDIMTALGFLLQPQGVLVKNELYFNKMSKIFDYTIQLDYEDIPVICAQALSLGSPARNFLDPTRYDHAVTNAAYNHYGKKNDAYDLIHDFMFNRNSDYKGQCVAAGTPDPVSDKQTASPGILMILEADQVHADILKSNKALQGAITKVLKSAGLSVLSTVTPKNDQETNVFIFKEGYVAVRCWTQEAYCGFDVLLWSSFAKHDALKVALVGAVGGQSSQQYRIVTGGMFGVSSWTEDEAKRGPRRPTCFDHPLPEGSGKSNDKAVTDAILLEGLSYFNATEPPTLAVVLCAGGDVACDSVDIVQAHKSIKDSLVLKACDNHMASCERGMFQAIADFTSKHDGQEIGAIVLDTRAPKSIAQITISIFKSHKHKTQYLKDGLVAVATMVDSKDLWRRTFLHRIVRDVVMYEPLFRGIAQFTGAEQGIEMGLFSSVNNTEFVANFLESVETIKAQHSLGAEIRHLGGGLWRYLADFTPSIFGRAGHYDHTQALEQWNAQKPLARQTVFQFSVGPATEHKEYKVGDRIRAQYKNEGTFPGTVKKVNQDGSYDVAFDDGDFESGVGADKIFEMAAKKGDGSTDGEILDLKNLQPILVDVVKEVFGSSVKQETKTLDKVGDGFVTVSTWKGGSAILLYDGRKHVDVNLFSKDSTKKLQDDFLTRLTKKHNGLGLTLRDEQPRGSGRVVNYAEDIAEWPIPHWTKEVDDSLFDYRRD